MCPYWLAAGAIANVAADDENILVVDGILLSYKHCMCILILILVVKEVFLKPFTYIFAVYTVYTYMPVWVYGIWGSQQK